MSRQPRIEFPGAVYHVTSRGNERRNIFLEPRDYVRFEQALAAVKEKFGIKVYAYVLMTNHFHLLIETPKPNLNKVMHSLKLRYVNYFNRKHNRTGVFYQGRYKSQVIDKDSYLLEVLRYILLNPIRAGMVEKLVRYRWSSYLEYISRGKITDTEEILKMFSEDRKTAIKKLKGHIAAGMKKDIKQWRMELYSDCVLGKESFIRKVKEEFRKKRIKKEVVLSANLKDEDKAEKLLKAVCEEYKIGTEGLRGKRGSKNEARKIGIYLLCRKTGLSNKEIAKFFDNIHYSTISHMRERVEKDVRLKRIADRILKRIEK